MVMRFFLLFSIVYFTFGSTILLTAQTSRVEFGKNRVQFHKKFKEWTYYEGDKTITYWYGDGRQVGQAAAQIAETEMVGIKDLLEHSISNKIEIIVYTDLTDLKQTNIGLEEAFEYNGGSTKILDNKIFIYFDGNHQNLRKLIRQGIAGVYLESILFGTNLQEIVQNAVSFNLPNWFKAGLVAFVGEEWSVEADNTLKDILLNGKIKNFDHLVRVNPQLAGQAFWYFVSKNYGQTAVANLLYLVRINRSVDAGFLYVLGNTRKAICENVLSYFRGRFERESFTNTQDSLKPISLPNRKNENLTRIATNPINENLALATNQLGKVRIYLQENHKAKRKLIFRKGYRNTFQLADVEYPHMVWTPDGKELLVIHENHDKLSIGRFDISTRKWSWDPMAPYFERIHSLDIIDKGRILLTATVNGVSDIFIYYLSTKQTVRVTNDFYDDLEAKSAIVNKQKGIIFISNRQSASLSPARLDSIMPLQKFDVFFSEIDTDNPKIIRLTDTPESNEASPSWVDSTHFTFFTEESGNWNRKIGHTSDIITDTIQTIYFKDGSKVEVSIDSFIPNINRDQIDTITFHPLKQLVIESVWASHYSQSVIPDKLTGQGVIKFYKENQKTKAGFQSKITASKIFPIITEFREDSNKKWYISQHLNKVVVKPKEITKDTSVFNKTVKIQTNKDTSLNKKNPYFQSEFDDEVPTIQYAKPSEPLIEEKAEVEVSGFTDNKKFVFKNARIIPYRLAFKTDYITTRLDNSPLFGGLDNYVGKKLNNAGNGNNFTYVPLGILLTTNFKDILEDHVFEVGARFPTTFRGGEYFITYRDRKYRWDKSYSYYYSGQQNVIDPSAIDNNFMQTLPASLQFQVPPATPIFPQFRTKVITNLVQAEFRYPFDMYRSLRFRTLFRNDKMFWKATEKNTLNTRNYNEQRISQRIEYVFDNTLSTGINLLNGTRYKIYSEVVKGTQIQLEPPLSFDFRKGYLGIVGFDFRHYQPILKKSVLAFRLASEVSFGTEKILNILGGVDNWLLPEFNNNIPLPQDPNYAYQTIAPGLRGFAYNIRNGSSYGLMSAELRIPIFRYISEKIRSSFIRNFQLVGFFDAGSAWNGFSPFANDNPINTIFLENPPTVKLKINYYRDPFVAGFGFGARTSLLGYFIRADYGYGIETKVVGKPILHLAFGTDF